MRARTQLVVAALALPLLAGLTACGEIQQAQETGNKAKICLEAVQIATFAPSWTNLEQARADAQAKADQVAKLVEQTQDATLKQHLEKLHTSIEKVANGEVTPAESAQWMQEQYATYQELTAACSSVG